MAPPSCLIIHYIGSYGFICRGVGEERGEREERGEIDEGKNCLCIDTVGQQVIHCQCANRIWLCMESIAVWASMCVCVCVDLTHLWVGQIYRPGEDDPLHYLAAGWRGQRSGVSVITVHRRWQQIPQDEWPEVGLLFCVEHGINTCQYTETKSAFFCAGTKTPYLSLFNALLKTLHILGYTYTNVYKFVSFHSPRGILTAFLKTPLVEWWWRQLKASPLVITLARSLCSDELREEQRERSQIKWPALTADLWLGGSLLCFV